MSAAEQVLICAPIGRDAALASAILMREGIVAAVCDTVAHACEAVSDTAGAMIVGEEALTGPDVRTLVETLDAQPPWSDIPIIVLAGREFSTSAIRPINVLGPLRNVMILDRPV